MVADYKVQQKLETSITIKQRVKNAKMKRPMYMRHCATTLNGLLVMVLLPRDIMKMITGNWQTD